MATTSKTDWRQEFGLAERGGAEFVRDPSALDALGPKAPQAHALRRAFDQLDLDGVLCQERMPLIYFKVVDRLAPAEAARLHRLFWNQGVASVLVLIAPDEVHIYSGLAQPVADDIGTATRPAGLVETFRLHHLFVAGTKSGTVRSGGLAQKRSTRGT